MFGLCAALGFRFAPRIGAVFDQRLFTIGRPDQDYSPFNQVLTDRINTRVITENWDEVLRVAGSIRHGTVSAALIMRKLAAYPRQTQIARALNEIGQLEKTIFILELLLDPQLRRLQGRGLNDGEAVNSASRALSSSDSAVSSAIAPTRTRCIGRVACTCWLQPSEHGRRRIWPGGRREAVQLQSAIG